MTRGLLIAFEGGEGAGKSTQAQRLAGRLGAVATREPGGTTLGGQLRQLLLDPASVGLDPRAEALLMAADRAQHVAEVVAPALAAGRHVVTDRWIGSSLAYQGAGRRLDLDELRQLSAFAVDGVAADLVVYLDVDVATAQSRLDGAADRLEAAGVEFHERVRKAFLALAIEPGWVLVDGRRPPDEVAAAVWAEVAPLLAGNGPPVEGA